MERHPLNKMWDNIIKDWDAMMEHMEEGIAETITQSFDVSQLMDIVTKMGIPSLAGVRGAQIPGFDPYRILGLEKTASDEEVRKRYRELLFKLHPDQAGVQGTEFLMQMVLLAYDMIKRERGWK